MSEQFPTGIVTFLRTDVQGSSRLWVEQPSVMADVIERHNQIIRRAAEQQGGVEALELGLREFSSEV